jgi:hypothetical protein
LKIIFISDGKKLPKRTLVNQITQLRQHCTVPGGYKKRAISGNFCDHLYEQQSHFKNDFLSFFSRL